jgi:hypothetical protein
MFIVMIMTQNTLLLTPLLFTHITSALVPRNAYGIKMAGTLELSLWVIYLTTFLT